MGHDVGDKVLVSTVEVVKSCLRESDIFARVGGEEFMIIFPQSTIDVTREISERIRNRVEHNDIDKSLHVTVSLGLIAYQPKESMEDMLKRADIALYEAKHSGRNKVIVQA